MRKTLLVVALIASSFVGGAVVNGPGLEYARGWLESRLDGPVTPNETLDDPLDPFPSAPMPLLSGAEGQPDPTAISFADPNSAETPPPSSSEPAQSATGTTDPGVTTASTAPSTTEATTEPVKPAAETAPALLPPTAAQSNAPPAPPAPDPVPAPAPPASGDSPDKPAAPAAEASPNSDWADAPDSRAPASAVLPGTVAAATVASATQSTQVPTAPAAQPPLAPPAATAHNDPSWDALRQRMIQLGVTRYWIEGEPGGKVRFRCAIPLAGQRAVAQQFEGEGDNLAAATSTTLNRITLWQATESP